MALARQAREKSAMQFCLFQSTPQGAASKQKYLSIHRATLEPLQGQIESTIRQPDNLSPNNPNNGNGYAGIKLGSADSHHDSSNRFTNSFPVPGCANPSTPANLTNSNSINSLSPNNNSISTLNLQNNQLTDRINNLTQPIFSPKLHNIAPSHGKKISQTPVLLKPHNSNPSSGSPNSSCYSQKENVLPANISHNNSQQILRKLDLTDNDLPSQRFSSLKSTSKSLQVFNNELLALPSSVDDPNFDRIFVEKLELCSHLLDFSSPQADSKEKLIKARSLCEFIELFENAREIHKLSETQQKQAFDMLYENIFTQDPTVPIPGIRSDINVVITEPSWPHLFYCYQILNRFSQVFSNSPLININIAKQAINLSQLPDTNERMQLIAFLRAYFDNHPDDRLTLLKEIEKKLIDLRDGSVSPYCAMPLLIFLTHMYPRLNMDMMQYFLQIISQSVVPLAGLNFLILYHQNLRQLLATVLQGHPQYAMKWLRDLELRWPLTNGSKQQQFLEMLLFLFSKIPQDTFKPMAQRVFAFLAECVGSQHSKVSETAMAIWSKATPENWVGLNNKVAMHEMFENVSLIAEQKHWCKANAEKAQQALNDMNRINKNMYHQMKMAQKQRRAQRYIHRAPNDCQRGWAAIARKAKERSPNNEFDLNAKLKEFYDLFHNEKKETLAPTRFVPVIPKDKNKDKKK
ncbi:hypothetical protein TRFO_04550 [Tritrichomonas foetus]|uniref:Phosphoprotein phosphatase n=1 Tax=Tritrichomonas foetus TaxID=1144522 RepID=A0A1J4KDF6_9EUKA|nr:hypothetical protein TRFO_04550 [Tritrichomonas foetus]|eukprot:OHT09471.1 hypothetical protein TRFO_04550 [Tritrichomonas foetus]